MWVNVECVTMYLCIIGYISLWLIFERTFVSKMRRRGRGALFSGGGGCGLSDIPGITYLFCSWNQHHITNSSIALIENIHECVKSRVHHVQGWWNELGGYNPPTHPPPTHTHTQYFWRPRGLKNDPVRTCKEPTAKCEITIWKS